MRFFWLARLAPIVAALALPAAALAQFDLTVDPDRLDGTGFFFVDKDQGMNNTLTCDVDGPTITCRGQVQANAGADVVTITYRMDFPNSASASKSSAAVSQGTQVLIGVNVNFDVGADYFGQAAPDKCKASAKLRDNGGPPDSPDSAQASLSCDLRSDWRELDDDDMAGTPGDPPQAALDVIDAAFAARKDVSADTRKGKLTIKLKGEAAAPPPS
jgi:hypothetical protein